MYMAWRNELYTYRPKPAATASSRITKVKLFIQRSVETRSLNSGWGVHTPSTKSTRLHWIDMQLRLLDGTRHRFWSAASVSQLWRRRKKSCDTLAALHMRKYFRKPPRACFE